MNLLKIQNKTDASAEIMVYGDIGEFDDITSTGFIEELSALGSRDLTVRINSRGGSVFTAQAIFNAIRRHSGNTVALIDGMCASAATFIATACSKVVMPHNAIFMVHKPLTAKAGNADDFRRAADILDVVENTMLPIYAEKTGKTIEELKDILRNETYMTAQQALDEGFIDEIENTISIAASITGDFLNINGEMVELKNIPKELLNHVKSSNETEKEGVKPMDLAQLKAQYADVANEFKAEILAGNDLAIENAVKAERERILNIQESALEGQEELVKQAIENKTDAGTFAIQAMKAYKQAQQAKGADALAKINADAKNAVVENTTTTNETEEEKQKAKEKAEADEMVAYAKQLRGVK